MENPPEGQQQEVALDKLACIINRSILTQTALIIPNDAPRPVINTKLPHLQPNRCVTFQPLRPSYFSFMT